jgi:hypothetical protein
MIFEACSLTSLRYCWILIFSKNTGKIIEVKEYSNTALMQEVMESNEGA